MSEKYVEAISFAKEWNVTIRRIQMMCARGEIPGARKEGRSWYIPADSKKPSDKRITSGIFIKNKGPVDNSDGYADMLSLLCQEFRSDLDAIIGYSNIMKTSGQLSEKGLDNILTASNDCISAIQSISAWDSIKKYPRVRHKSIFAVNEVLEAVLEELKPYAEARSIRLIPVLTASDLKNNADREKYELLFKNLLGCAVKESGIGSIITFKVDALPGGSEKRPQLRYAIEGNSGSIPEGSFQFEMANVLVKFFRGKIDVSYRAAYGTKITVLLRHDQVDAPQAISHENRTSLVGKRVLLVEDNQFSLEVTKVILEQEGMIVDTAEDGIIAVAKVRMAQKPYYDYILTDLMMPNMDGITAAFIIKGLEDKEKAAIPIIALTSAGSEEARTATKEAGFKGLIEKPVDKNKLLRLLQEQGS